MLKNKKIKTLLSLISIACGSGLIYASTNDFISVGADTIKNSSEIGATLIVTLFIVGMALTAIGVMTLFFVVASKSEDY